MAGNTYQTKDHVTLRATSGADPERSYWIVEPGPSGGHGPHAGRTFSTNGTPVGEPVLAALRLEADIHQQGGAYFLDFVGQRNLSGCMVPARLEGRPVSRFVEVLPPHEYRAREERAALGKRIDALRAFVASPEMRKLDALDRALLEQQLAHMWLYYEDLGQRVQHWERKREGKS